MHVGHRMFGWKELKELSDIFRQRLPERREKLRMEFAKLEEEDQQRRKIRFDSFKDIEVRLDRVDQRYNTSDLFLSTELDGMLRSSYGSQELLDHTFLEMGRAQQYIDVTFQNGMQQLRGQLDVEGMGGVAQVASEARPPTPGEEMDLK